MKFAHCINNKLLFCTYMDRSNSQNDVLPTYII